MVFPGWKRDFPGEGKINFDIVESGNRVVETNWEFLR